MVVTTRSRRRRAVLARIVTIAMLGTLLLTPRLDLTSQPLDSSPSPAESRTVTQQN
jgi:hypothetical protein